MNQEELAERIRRGEATNGERLQLFNSLKRFCYRLARQYQSQLRCQEDVEDLVQESYIAVDAAARTFDPGKGVKFITWAGFYIRSAYADYIARQSGIGRSVVDQRYLLNKYMKEFADLWGRKPSNDEICRGLKISQEKLFFLLSAGKETSLNDEIGEDGAERAELIPDPHDLEAEVIGSLVSEEVRGVLRRFVNDLPRDEWEAVVRCFLQEQHASQAAREMGISVKQFRDHLRKGLVRLRASKYRRELGHYLPERVGSTPYGRGIRDSFSSTELAAIKSLEYENRIDSKGSMPTALRIRNHEDITTPEQGEKGKK